MHCIHAQTSREDHPTSHIYNRYVSTLRASIEHIVLNTATTLSFLPIARQRFPSKILCRHTSSPKTRFKTGVSSACDTDNIRFYGPGGLLTHAHARFYPPLSLAPVSRTRHKHDNVAYIQYIVVVCLQIYLRHLHLRTCVSLFLLSTEQTNTLAGRSRRTHDAQTTHSRARNSRIICICIHIICSMPKGWQLQRKWN